MLPKISILSVDDRPLAWREAGQGRPLVFLHDIGADSRSWEAQFAAFAEDHRVVAWDCPGFGASAPLRATSPAASDYAEAFSQLTTALGLRRPILVGAGLGALVAAAATARQDGEVAALALASVQARFGGTEAARYLSWLQDLVKDAVAFSRSFADAALAPHSAAGVRAAAERMAGTMTPVGMGRACQMMIATDLNELLKPLQLPMLLIYGDLDEITPPEAAAQMDGLVRGTVTEIVEHAAHLPQLEAPANFNRALRAFLRVARMRS